jgi:hypothetical protein
MLDQKTRAAVIRAADFFAANPDKRTTGQLARDAGGFATTPLDPEACTWCALGRIALELGINPNGNYDELSAIFGEETVGKIYNFNDASRTTSRVVDMLKGLVNA